MSTSDTKQVIFSTQEGYKDVSRIKTPPQHTPAIKPKGVTDYSHLLNSIYDSLFICAADGTILETNPRVDQDFGSKPHELNGRNILELIAGADVKLLEYIKEQQQQCILMEGTCLRKDGENFTAEIAVTRIPEQTPPIQCFFIREAAMRTQIEQELHEANAQLVEMEKHRAEKETIQEMCMELNNPLQILMSMSEAGGNAAYKQQLDRVIAVVEQMRKSHGMEPLAGGGQELATEEHWKPANPHHLLLADDEDQLCQLFCRAFSINHPQIAVDTTKNGQTAVDMFKKQHHGIIIMDVQMPGMSGIEAFRAIYEHCSKEQWYLPSVIFCSGYGMTDEVAEIIGDGSYHSYMHKPFSFSKLLSEVDKKLTIYGEK